MGLRSRRCGGSSGYRFSHGMTMQQRIVFVILTRRSSMTREQHIIRIDGRTAILNLLVFIHTFAGEKRGIRFTA